MHSFWNKKRVLVTGASGFIGSWLAEALVKKNAEVTTLLNPKGPFKDSAIRHLSRNIHVAKGDIKDKRTIAELAANHDIIFHLAAITQVLYAIQNPEETVAVNIGGTLNILEGMRKSSSRPFLVFVSTDKVYGEPEHLPIDEKHTLSAKSPYDASKVGADRLVYSYHKTYGTKATILRWANTYGGRDANSLRAVPDFVTSVLHKKAPVIRGNGTHIRDFLYIDDVVNALLLAGEKQKIANGQVFNLGTTKPTSIKDLANLIIKISGQKLRPITLKHKTPGEIQRQYLAFGKAKKGLGWEPAVPLEEGLKKTIAWYRENPWWEDIMKRVAKFYHIDDYQKSKHHKLIPKS